MKSRAIHDKMDARRWSRRAAPWFILAVSLAVTILATLYLSWTTRHTDELRFDHWATQTRRNIERRVQTYAALLTHTAGFIRASHPVSRQTFLKYTASLDLRRAYPAARGLGFVIREDANQGVSLDAPMTGQAANDGQLVTNPAGAPPFSRIYIAPPSQANLKTLADELLRQPGSRAAMEMARDSGKPVATGKITPPASSSAGDPPEFILYAPIYRGENTSTAVAARRQTLAGFTFVVLRVDDLLAEALPPRSRASIHVDIYDGARVTPQSRLDGEGAGDPSSFIPRFKQVRTVDIAGRPWTLALTSRPAFERTLFSWLLVPVTMTGGIIISLLLFGVMLTQTQAHDQAVSRAAALRQSEQALRESEQYLEIALAAADMFAFTWDLKHQKIQRVGDPTHVLGITPPDSPRQVPEVVIHPDDRLRWAQAEAAAVAGEAPLDIEFRLARKPGEADSWVRVKGAVEFDERGNAKRLIGICAHISRQKRVEHQLKALNQTLEQRVADRTAESEQRNAQLRALAAELTQAEQRERRRLAQVLHDHLQQLLVAAMMRLEIASRLSPDLAKRRELDHIYELVRQSIDCSRSLTIELSPPVLYDAGLAKGLEWLGRTMREKHGLNVELICDPDAEPSNEDAKAFIFQAVRELLFNIVKHAGVDRATVEMTRSPDDELYIRVADEGPGLDMDILRIKGEKAEHFGLFSIQQRLERLGGRFEVESSPGHGTRIGLILPLDAGPAQPVSVDAVLDDLPGAEAYNMAEKLLDTYTHQGMDGEQTEEL